jgi:hypothetical protein
VRPNSVLESALAVPILESIVPEKGTQSNCLAAFEAILVAEKIQFSEGRIANMSGSDCILADQRPGSEISRALANV